MFQLFSLTESSKHLKDDVIINSDSLNISKANKKFRRIGHFQFFVGKTANGTGLSFSTPVQSTGKFCTIRPWKFPEIHTGISGRMVSALDFGNFENETPNKRVKKM